MIIPRVSHKGHCKTLPCIQRLSGRTRITCPCNALTPLRQFTLPRLQPITREPDIDYAAHLFNLLTEIRQH